MFDFDKPARYAVMGNPVSHSKSPRIHTAFAQQTGQRMEYLAIQVDVGGFPQAVAQFRANGGRGINVTVPFKLDAHKLADQLSARARLAGAVNILKFDAEGPIAADNLDGVGLVRDLTVNLGIALRGRRLLVLGAGGASRGILGPLLVEGPQELVLANRTVAKAKDLADAFAVHGKVAGVGFDDLAGRRFDLVLNATAASLQGQVPPLPAAVFAPGALAYDLMYSDQPTPFMTWAKAHGAGRVADGLGMLVEQAAESFQFWRGVRPDTKPVFASLRSPLRTA